jgi:hypothetical protein
LVPFRAPRCRRSAPSCSPLALAAADNGPPRCSASCPASRQRRALWIGFTSISCVVPTVLPKVPSNDTRDGTEGSPRVFGMVPPLGSVACTPGGASTCIQTAFQLRLAVARDTAPAMSQANVDFVRRGWEAYESGDLSAALETFSPDLVTYVAPPIPRRWHIPGTRGVPAADSRLGRGLRRVGRHRRGAHRRPWRPGCNPRSPSR